MVDIWTHRETRDSEYASAMVGDYQIDVQDFDGDFSEWTIKFEGDVIANGGCSRGNHFEACKAAAWATVHSLETTASGYVMTLGFLDQEEQAESE